MIDQGPWSQVGVGLRFLCALKAQDQQIYCYGQAYDGELGNGAPVGEESVQYEMTPIKADGLQFASLSVGASHACGITVDKKMYCWGANPYGQLGNGDDAPSSIPVQVSSNFEDWREISCGEQHTCATRINEEGWCWGHNNFKQVSADGEPQTLIPSKIDGTWKTISAGPGFTLGIAGNGMAFGWGLKEQVDIDFAFGGLLGDGSPMCFDPETGVLCDVNEGNQDYGYYNYGYGYPDVVVEYEETPVPVAGEKQWSSISAGLIPCAIEAKTSALYCWGYSIGEALAEGSPQTNFPVRVDDGNASWVSISSSPSSGRCGIHSDGSGWCWGRNEFDCEGSCALGDGTDINSAIPVKVIDVDSWLAAEVPSPPPPVQVPSPPPNAPQPPPYIPPRVDPSGRPPAPSPSSRAFEAFSVMKMFLTLSCVVLSCFVL